MVTQYGFSNAVGSVSYGNGGEVFIGRDMAQQRDYSEATAQTIDREVRAIVEAAHNEAYRALVTNRKVLDALAKALMERETLNQEDIAKIFKTVKKLPRRKQWLSAPKRVPSKVGPIAIPKRAASTSTAKPERKTTAKKPTRTTRKK
jgi:cell division protease FtsH